MDEEEQEDLLVQVSESDESQEESDAYLDLDSRSSRVISCPPFGHGPHDRCCFRKRIEFLCTGFICLASCTALLILLPLYLESSNEVADVYTSLLFPTVVTVIFSFCCLFIFAKLGLLFSASFKENLRPPFPVWRCLQVGLVHGIAGLCTVYALDRQRVLCHIQDPIKGVTLIFSMIYYFCFSKKLMGLQKIFCALTVVIGLFVSVDYALCDEFHCRGYEREHVRDDAGHWSRAAHFLWGLNYIGGLALWSFHFSLLEGNIVALQLTNPLVCLNKSSLLETISCTISSRGESLQPDVGPWESEDPLLASGEGTMEHNGRRNSVKKKNPTSQQRVTSEGTVTSISSNQTRSGSENVPSSETHRPSALSIIFWIYLFNLVTILFCFWTALVPSVGKASSWSDFTSNARNGILCHFTSHTSLNSLWENGTLPSSDTVQKSLCSTLALYGWLFSISLLIFSASACHFLLLSQSSVFTVALATASLPIVNVFWSFFRLVPVSGGIIQWWPNFTPELVCTLLGIPIIATGLTLLCKAHWSNVGVQKELCCTLRYHPRTVPS